MEMLQLNKGRDTYHEIVISLMGQRCACLHHAALNCEAIHDMERLFGLNLILRTNRHEV